MGASRRTGRPRESRPHDAAGGPKSRRGAASAARLAAVGLVRDARLRGARIKDLARGSAPLERLSERDRSLAMRLATGVVATSGALDRSIDSHLTGRVHLEPRVRDALRVSAFELLFLRTPASVAVDQGVELVRAQSPRAAGLANAVLRRVAELDRPLVEAARERLSEGEGLAPSTSDLGLVSGLPEWIVNCLVGTVGGQVACQVCLEELEPAPVYVQANPAARGYGEVASRLEELGLGPRPVEGTGALLLEAPQALAASGLVQRAEVVPADLAAQLVARIAAPRPGSSVLEVGQGRGTKTLLLEAAAIEGGGPARILGVDSEPFKCRVSEQRMEAAGLAGHVTSLALDARRLADKDLPPEVDDAYDLVFVDAPCSGTGTMRRHAEIAWSLDQEALLAPGAALPALQLDILRASSTRVRPGGELVYSTCSFLPQENGRVVEAFLASDAGAGFELLDPAEAWGVRSMGEEGADLVRSFSHGGSFLSVPGKWPCDMHFCACMRRVR